MAGDIQEPFMLNFQAHSVHSGSISFGRFETEGLCWERRSLFSHNKYLEEVEKFSKPGSVTEKKAYFEAHFKKKALQSQSSLASQNETEWDIGENEASESLGPEEEFEHVHEGRHNASCEKSNGYLIQDRELQPEALEAEDTRMPVSEALALRVFDNYDTGNRIADLFTTENACERETEKVLLRDSAVETKAKENLSSDCAAESSDVSSKTILSSANTTSERDDSVSSNLQPIPPPKIGRQHEHKSSKFTSRSGVGQNKIKMATEASKGFAKQPAQRENGSSNTQKSGNHPPAAATSTMMSVHKIIKHKVSQDAKGKLLPQARSGQMSRIKKGDLSKPRPSEKANPQARDVPNSNRRSLSSEKQARTQNSVSSSTSNGRVEPRKEEKLARDCKQLQKSSSFKATPLPSFYKITDRADKSMAMLPNNKKSVKIQNKSPSPCSGVAASVHSTNSQRVPGVTTSRVHPERSGKSSDHDHQISQAAVDSYATKKEERGKLKQTNASKHGALEGSKASQEQKRVEGDRGRSIVARKDSREIHLRSHSRTHNMAIGVGVLKA